MQSTVYLCKDTAEGILSGVYEAYRSPVPNSQITLRTDDQQQFSFLEERIPVQSSFESAARVLEAIQKKLGFRCYGLVEGALCASADDKANAVFQFLRYGFYKNTDISEELNISQVMRVFELNRKSRGEAHLMTGFTRFRKLSNGVYFSKIGPVNNILPLVADHFAGRFNTQPFMIYDEKRRLSVVYAPGTNWYFVEGEVLLSESGLIIEDAYESLWKTFFDTIAIKERTNPVCQRTHLPLHFREYMPEFNK